jgi:hypothetical protein
MLKYIQYFGTNLRLSDNKYLIAIRVAIHTPCPKADKPLLPTSNNILQTLLKT